MGRAKYQAAAPVSPQLPVEPGTSGAEIAEDWSPLRLAHLCWAGWEHRQPKCSAEEQSHGPGGGESTPKGSGTENMGWLCLERHRTECPPSEPAPVRVGASRISSPCPPGISSEEWGCSSRRKRHSGSSPGPPQSSQDPWP